MKTTILIIGALLILIVVVLLIHQHQSENAALETMGTWIKNQGGADNLRKPRKGMVTILSKVGEDDSAFIEEWFDFPKSFKRTTTFSKQGQKRQKVILQIDDVVRMREGNGPIVDAPPDTLGFFESFAILAEFKDQSPTSLKRETIDGLKLSGVRLNHQDLFFSREDGVLRFSRIRTELPSGAKTLVEVRYSKHKVFDGIQIPHRQEISSTSIGLRDPIVLVSEKTIVELKLVDDLDPKVFSFD